jgi:cytochrome c oxidase subunit IV
MRRIALFSLLLALAVVVVGISFALLRNLQQPLLVYVIVMPILVTLLVILVMVGRVTFKKGQKRDER